jgi:hypothetical protein
VTPEQHNQVVEPLGPGKELLDGDRDITGELSYVDHSMAFR